jgi:surface polysaccharide O-acyltransferase-like enzyme
LDTLRGLAIVLMVVDHVADFWFGIPIAGSPIRFVTRMAMPLFCVLMGYFFQPSNRFRFKRLGQIALASLLANAVFWPYYHRIEILGCLLLAYLTFLASGRFFQLFVFAILLYPLDNSTALLDFPISIVLSFVAQGMVLRHLGIVPALVTGTLLSSGALWIREIDPRSVNYLLCFFVMPAILLVDLGQAFPRKRIPGLDFLGRHPLAAYLTQYYTITLVYYLFLR